MIFLCFLLYEDPLCSSSPAVHGIEIAHRELKPRVSFPKNCQRVFPCHTGLECTYKQYFHQRQVFPGRDPETRRLPDLLYRRCFFKRNKKHPGIYHTLVVNGFASSASPSCAPVRAITTRSGPIWSLIQLANVLFNRMCRKFGIDKCIPTLDIRAHVCRPAFFSASRN